MINQRFPFRSSKSRLTKKQQLRIELNELILLYFLKHDEYVTAETVWLELVASEQHISISSFYNRLRELVDGLLIEKKSNAPHKFVYKLISKTGLSRSRIF
jgi:Fe2+ or Zn2+ uptake regulation protein